MGKFLLFPQDGSVRVTSPYGWRNGSKHNGVDLASDNQGVDWNIAAADGVVTKVAHEKTGAGIYLSIKVDFPVNGKPAWIRYFHLKDFLRFYDRSGQPAIKVGDRIKQGEKIGIEGSTGHSAGAHLHFELLLGAENKDYSVDPVPHLWIPKALPVDPGQLTQTQFRRIKYVEDFKEEDDMILKFGDKGKPVVALQTGLGALGYTLGGFGATGNYLELTVEAVKHFQTVNGLAVDGQAGPDTISMLMIKLAERLSAPNVKLAKAKDLATVLATQINAL